MIGYKKSAVRIAAAVAGYACVSFASVSAGAQESVHTQLNGIIKQYSGVTGASMTNPDVQKLFDKDGFSDYLSDYPVGNLALGYVWKVGMGATSSVITARLRSRRRSRTMFRCLTGRSLIQRKHIASASFFTASTTLG